MKRLAPLALVLALATSSAGTLAQEAPQAEPSEPSEDVIPTAPVVVDGATVLRLRGAASYTAERRAAAVAQRVVDAARDPSLDPATLRIVEAGSESRVVAGSTTLVRLLDGDGAVESLSRKTLAEVALGMFRNAIVSYRAARTREALLASAGRASLAFLLAALAAVVVLRLGRALDRRLERHLHERIRTLAIQSFEVLRAERMWGFIRGFTRFAKGVALALIAYLFLRYALAQFPWSRGAAASLDGWILRPLAVIGGAFVAKLPDLVFLVVLFFITRWALGLLRLFFAAVGRGEVSFAGFEREWADPTYKLLRVVVLLFAAVIAYPYIPGSSTEAFKGISLFFGVLLSLGASSFIANVIAGFLMTYRRAFREGDVIRIEDTIGRVTSVRTVVTHLRTPKNEEVVVPNSKIIGTEIVNYTTLARAAGLILHTTVGIGYGTPWRQVEAMLLEAARRTPGLLAEPVPFVLQKSLGEFAVTYEINVPCGDPVQMPRLYTELHRRILDVFNEYGVQIMTPAYEGDPEQPKVVPPERWHQLPASEPEPPPVRMEPK